MAKKASKTSTWAHGSPAAGPATPAARNADEPGRHGATPDKYPVLIIMLLLLMMPMAYLFTIGPDAPPPAASSEMKDPDGTGKTVAASDARDDLTTAATVERGVRNEDQVKLTDLSGTPAMLKLDPQWQAERKTRAAPKKPVRHLANARKRVAANTGDPGMKKDGAAGGSPQAEPDQGAPGEPIGAQVSRCRALGLIEGELCRLRTCAGFWDKDPACSTGSGKTDG